MAKFIAGQSVKYVNVAAEVFGEQTGKIVREDMLAGEFGYQVESEEATRFIREVDLEAGEVKAKVGDKIEVKSAYYHFWDEGTIATVIDEDRFGDGGSVRARIENGSEQTIKHGDYTIVAEATEAAPAAKKFRVVNDSEAAGYYHEFKVGEIVEATAEFMGMQLYRNEAGKTQILKEKDVEAVVEEAVAVAAEPAAEFEKGDVVVLKVPGGMYPLNGYTQGEAYEVIDTNFPDHPRGLKIAIAPIGVQTDEHKAGYVSADQIEKAVAADAEDLKPGDVIQIIEKERAYVTAGKKYEIVRIDSYGDARIVDNDGDEVDADGYEFIVVSKAPEKAEDPAIADYHKVEHKVGDVIRLVDPLSFLTVGKEYTVKEIDWDDAVISDDDGDDKDLCGDHSHFVLVRRADEVPAVRAVSGTKEMFLANGAADDMIAGKLYAILEDDRDMDGTVKIMDEAGDTQWVDSSEGQFVTVSGL